jgi:delta1-piperideine-2-carboxylate reductase
LQAERVPATAAQILAGSIVAAERDGTLSHGLARLPDYLTSLRAGWITPDAKQKIILKDTPFVQVQGDNGFTQVAGHQARELVLERVARFGIALLSVNDAHHIGALWTDIEPYSERGFVALNFVNSRPRLAPYGANTPLLGTNAMAFAFPDGQGGVTGWDQASSRMSLGEVKRYALCRQPLPFGIGLDRHGEATTDAAAVLNGGALLPFGDHKGSSIALMVEVMAAALTGANFGHEDTSIAFPGAASSNAGQALIVIDPVFRTSMPFAARITGLIAYLHSDATLRLPGERRRQNRARGERDGINISSDAAILLGLA